MELRVLNCLGTSSEAKGVRLKLIMNFKWLIMTVAAVVAVRGDAINEDISHLGTDNYPKIEYYSKDINLPEADTHTSLGTNEGDDNGLREDDSKETILIERRFLCCLLSSCGGGGRSTAFAAAGSGGGGSYALAYAASGR